MRYEMHNLDGRGDRRTPVYDMAPKPMTQPGAAGMMDYWGAVTDVPCPCCHGGTIRARPAARPARAPGYRICDTCGRHFMARGNATAPILLRVGTRRSKSGLLV